MVLKKWMYNYFLVDNILEDPLLTDFFREELLTHYYWTLVFDYFALMKLVDMKIGKNLAKTFSDYYKLSSQLIPKPSASGIMYRSVKNFYFNIVKVLFLFCCHVPWCLNLSK